MQLAATVLGIRTQELPYSSFLQWFGSPQEAQLKKFSTVPQPWFESLTL